MAEDGGTGGLDTRRSEKYGEKIEVLEKQRGEISSLLQSVVDVVGRQQRERGGVSWWGEQHHQRGRAYASTRSRSCLLYTSPSPRDATLSRMPSSA